MKIQQEKSKSTQPQDINQAARISKNSFALLLANGIDLTFGLVSIVLFTRYLGVEIYGQYAFIISIVRVFITLPHFGMRRIIMREVTMDKENVQHYLGSVIILRCILSALAFGAVAITIKLLGLSGIYLLATCILMASEIIAAFSMAFMSIFFALEKMAYNTLLTTINRALGIALILIVVFLDLGFIPLMLSLLLPNISALYLSYKMVAKKVCKPCFSINLGRLKYLLIESLPLFFELLFRQCFIRVDIFVLKALRSVAEISLFSAPYTLILRLQVIPTAFTTSLLPYFTRLANTSKISLETAYGKIFKILFCISLPISIATTIFADRIIIIIFGADFSEATIVLQILIWMINLMFLEALFNTILVAIKKQWFSAISHAFMFLINLLLDIILIPYYGFVGACVATVVAYVVRFIIFHFYLSSNNISLPINKIIFKPLLCGAFMGVLMRLFVNANMFFTTLIGFIAYISAMILTGVFSKEEITMFKKSMSLHFNNLKPKYISE